MPKNIFNNLFNNKVKKEQEKYSDYNISHIITKKFLKSFPDENIRRKIYESYGGLDINYFNYFQEIYSKNEKVAMYLLENNILINSDKLYNAIVSNIELLDKFCSIGININFTNYEGLDINMINTIMEIVNKRGKEAISLLNEKNENYIKILSNPLFDKLDITFIKGNVNILNKILSQSNSSKQEFLLNAFIYNPNIFNNEFDELINMAIRSGIEIFDFLNHYQWNDKTYTFVKENGIRTISQLLTKLKNSAVNDIELSSNYIDFIIKYAEEKNMLDDYKNAVNMKYTIYSYFENNKIFKEYYMRVDDLEVKKLMETLKKINESKTIDEIKQILSTFTVKISPKEYNDKIVRSAKKHFSNSIFHPEKVKEIDGVKIIDNSTFDLSKYKMLVHVINDRKSNDSPNGDLSLDLMSNPELWIKNNYQNSSNFVCCSLISQYDTVFFGDVFRNSSSVILGFSDVENTHISGVSGGDRISEMVGDEYDFGKSTEFLSSWQCPPEEVTDDLRFSKNGHNEITIGRIINGETIRPSYILSTINFEKQSKNRPINENMIKWAKYFNIPIVRIDGNIVYETAKRELENLLLTIKNNQISFELFEKMLLEIRTIENVKNDSNKLINIFEYFSIFLDACLKNPSIENIKAIKKIIQKYEETIIENDINSYGIDNKEKIKNERLQTMKHLLEKVKKYEIEKLSQPREELINQELANLESKSSTL